MKTDFPASQQDTDLLAVNLIRTLSMDAIQKANSGHPGAPMGLAAAAYVLFTRIMKHNPGDPRWQDRDRFVLSGGHASMLLYSILHLTGYDVSMEDIQNFRQLGSKTPGHPEYGHTPGVETTTGPLGQGIANAVGLAMAERHLAARFNRPGLEIVDHHTFVICGDGDLMEGISQEAASLAGHLGLSKLILLYDSNRISIEGSTDITFTENTHERFSAMNWHVVEVWDGNDLAAIEKAVLAAKAETEKPSIVILHTHIAYGSPNKQDTADAHGAPLGEEEIRLTKTNLGCLPDECFCVPDSLPKPFAMCMEKGKTAQKAWEKTVEEYTNRYQEDASLWEKAISSALPENLDALLPVFTKQDGPIATRAASGKVLNALASAVPEMIGGSADLAPSNKTLINDSRDFEKPDYAGRNIRFGVREHAMGAILNGMALHKGLRPYGGTFLVFADYMRPAIRLAALMRLPVIYVFTHDSIAVGEDGPTHQPVEHLASLRAIPGLTVIRPCDANETRWAWKYALANQDGPTALVLSRQKLPVLDDPGMGDPKDLEKGAYVLSKGNASPQILMIATGAEVHPALGAQKQLEAEGISARVISMPCWELFDAAPDAYKQGVLPQEAGVRISVEAGIPMGWEKYLGPKSTSVSMTGFGTSAPGGVLLEKFGFTPENIAEKAKEVLNQYNK